MPVCPVALIFLPFFFFFEAGRGFLLFFFGGDEMGCINPSIMMSVHVALHGKNFLFFLSLVFFAQKW